MTRDPNRISLDGLRLRFAIPLTRRRTALFAGAVVCAAVSTGIAYLLLREPGPDTARLYAALNAFTGEWEGEASVQSAGAETPPTLRVTRRYFWIGARQIVEMRFALGADEQVNRAIQWIDDGRLHALGSGPGGGTEMYSGALTADGILWTNLDRPKADRLDRLVPDGSQPTLQSASILPLRLGDVSGPVGVAAVLLPLDTGSAPVATLTAPAPEPNDNRAAELERALAALGLEREALRAQLARAEAKVTSNSNPARTPAPDRRQPEIARPESRASQLEIRTSPPGMKFEVWTEDLKSKTYLFAFASGTTPVTLTAVPPGDYAVLLQRDEQRKTVHHLSIQENRDMFLFHREDRTNGTDTMPLVPFDLPGTTQSSADEAESR